MLQNWEELKQFGIALNLPHVELTTSWNNPVLKAHGKLWTWWSPYVEAALFKCCLLYTSPSPRDRQKSRMPSSA